MSHVDADGGALFDGLALAMSRIGGELTRILARGLPLIRTWPHAASGVGERQHSPVERSRRLRMTPRPAT